MAGGTIIRHIQGINLLELEKVIENLPYRVTPINTFRVGSTFYISFMVNPLAVNESPKALPIEMSEKTITKKPIKKKSRSK